MLCEWLTESKLEDYLSKRISGLGRLIIRSHLDKCYVCWNRWNRFRWDRARGKQGYNELKEYLGKNFVDYLDSSWALATDWNSRNPQTLDEVESFYRETPFYMYSLMIWEESGQRPRYVDMALDSLKYYECRTICDFGCGIGNDGLKLLANGYEVIFCDFDNPSTKFLRWRLKQRGIYAAFIEPYDLPNIHGFDTLWAMDVIEHLVYPHKTLPPFLTVASKYFHATDSDSKAHGRQPFHIHHPKRYLRGIYRTHGFKQVRSAIESMELWIREQPTAMENS